MNVAELLDQLMGKERNLTPEQRAKVVKKHFSDDDVCRAFLGGFCPHDLFINTKADLGPCPKLHDPALKMEYDMLTLKDRLKYGFDFDFLDILEDVVAQMDRKIARNVDKVAARGRAEVSSLNAGQMRQLEEMAAVIERMSADIRRLGEDGKLDEAQALTERLEGVQAERDAIKATEKTMAVCDVCGAYRAPTDTEERITSHLEGKQHTGFVLIRETIDDLRNRVRNQERPVRGYTSTSDRPRSRSRERSSRSRGRSSRDRSRDRDRRGSSRSSRRRSRSRDRSRRSRSPRRDSSSRRRHRSRSRDRSRDRSSRRHRSRSRDRSSRHRSGSRDRR